MNRSWVFLAMEVWEYGLVRFLAMEVWGYGLVRFLAMEVWGYRLVRFFGDGKCGGAH